MPAESTTDAAVAAPRACATRRTPGLSQHCRRRGATHDSCGAHLLLVHVGASLAAALRGLGTRIAGGHWQAAGVAGAIPADALTAGRQRERAPRAQVAVAPADTDCVAAVSSARAYRVRLSCVCPCPPPSRAVVHCQSAVGCGGGGGSGAHVHSAQIKQGMPKRQ